MKKFVITTLALFLLMFYYADAQAPDSSKKYQFFLEPYLLFPGLSGTTGIGNLPDANLSAPASKVLGYLQFGSMLYAEVHNNKWAFTTDLLYASLSQSATGKNYILSGSADIKQLAWELEALYKVAPFFEVGVGTRLNSMKVGLNVNFQMSTGNVASANREQTNTWVDPLVVIRIKTWASPKWLASFRADVGGFGVGSKIAWQLQPDIAYRASKLLQIGLGYRIISTDYDNNKSGTDRFLYDMKEYGPQIRIGFNF